MAKQTFTTGQVLTAAQMTSLQQTAMGGGSATAKTASYTLVAADAGATVIMNSASATTITVNTSLFSAGDTVFIQNIGAGISTITAGTATVNTASSLALAQYESGNLYFTAAAASIFSKADGASAGGGGKVLQVQAANKIDTFTMNSLTFTDVTDLSVSITPAAATSKILINVSIGAISGDQYNQSFYRIVRNSTDILLPAAAGNRTVCNFASYPPHADKAFGIAYQIYDSPNTTSATTYKIQVAASANVTVNGTQTNNNATGDPRTTSTITVMEIGA